LDKDKTRIFIFLPTGAKLLAAFIIIITVFPFCSHSQNWQSIFKGINRSGWEQKGGSAQYIVENNEIVAITVEDENNSFLCTKEVLIK
jgi:hypothetical protein